MSGLFQYWYKYAYIFIMVQIYTIHFNTLLILVYERSSKRLILRPISYNNKKKKIENFFKLK